MATGKQTDKEKSIVIALRSDLNDYSAAVNNTKVHHL